MIKFVGTNGQVKVADFGIARAMNAPTESNLTQVGSVILGGTALTGGRGGVVGTLLGVIFLGALANGMNLMGLPGYWQIFVQGVVLIAAVVLDKLVNRS